MRLVLDTNVIVAAFRSKKGASARLLDAAYVRRFAPVANVALFAEWEDVLTRPEHLAAASLTAEAVREALDDLAGRIAIAERAYSWRPQLTDPDDEMVLEAAINGAADAIVTFETKTFAAPARRFGIDVLTPARAWSMVRP